jgi:transposase-like protein
MAKPKSDWSAIVEAYKTSGQRLSEWCRANNISPDSLSYWLQKEKKAAEQEKNCQWLMLDHNILESATGNQSLLLQIGPVRLAVNPGFDPQFLTDVVKTIIAAC